LANWSVLETDGGREKQTKKKYDHVTISLARRTTHDALCVLGHAI